ncbi:uncharacterized protein LOC110226884 isoform X1 [Arabidopsis lyrata subsp. lyrata]|uniref:uncharacterized protein LOC110226884 isoform X1 n=1 Tax=Arabidopsis lyrata subsp. lyrata TaxID=81972 RepID=UPI000A29E536|nr:uncharacterized protein LOC110226884 isoform X1 [Arabidopsis lyrata subsp. lyrata]|eukprot:XP_020875416.1 uncharacterized protein LOC110226884 isoform X1 [Arabidopsis lyrata subsp. lyrata]
MRAMGRNMTKTKLACFEVNHKCIVEMEKKQIHLQDKVNELENKLGKLQNQGQETEVGENSRSAAGSVNKKAQPKCILIDWAGDDANVAEGRIISTDPEDVVNGTRLGPLDYKVLVETATVPEAFLWRNAMGMSTIEESVGHMIAWPATKCVSLEQGVQEEDMAPLGTRANSLNKCKLLDLSNDDVVVAEGRWTTQDRKALVNGLSLGPKAVKVFVDVVHEANTFIWRPTMDVTYIEDCLMSFVAWPFNKVVFENNPDGTGRLSPIQNYASTQTAHGKSASSSQKSTATGSKSQPAHGRSASASKKSAATGSKSHMQPISASCEKSPTTVPKSNAVETQTAAPSRPLRRSPRKKGAIQENQKCMLLDIKERKQVVAEGRVISTDPERRVHCAPLGLNAAQVLVDIVQVDDAAVWRTSYEIEYMKDALGSFIAWPTDNLVMY